MYKLKESNRILFVAPKGGAQERRLHLASSKTDRLLKKLQGGARLSAKQITHTCGFSSPNSVYGTICRLREEGFKIKTTESKNGVTQYTM